MLRLLCRPVKALLMTMRLLVLLIVLVLRLWLLGRKAMWFERLEQVSM